MSSPESPRRSVRQTGTPPAKILFSPRKRRSMSGSSSPGGSRSPKKFKSEPSTYLATTLAPAMATVVDGTPALEALLYGEAETNENIGQDTGPTLFVGAEEHLMFPILDYPSIDVSNYVICRDWFTSNSYPTSWSEDSSKPTNLCDLSESPLKKRKITNTQPQNVQEFLSEIDSREFSSLFEEMMKRGKEAQAKARLNFQKDLEESLKQKKIKKTSYFDDENDEFKPKERKYLQRERSDSQNHIASKELSSSAPPFTVQTRQSKKNGLKICVKLNGKDQ